MKAISYHQPLIGSSKKKAIQKFLNDQYLAFVVISNHRFTIRLDTKELES
jgi:hypothetical protein